MKLVARCANVEGVGEVTVRDLVRQALRMRPDRIVVGEVRGAEVVDLLAALNTGHDGGAGTVHANNPAEVPARLEALAALGGLDRAALHSQLGARRCRCCCTSAATATGQRRLERDRGAAARRGRPRPGGRPPGTPTRGFDCGADYLRELLRDGTAIMTGAALALALALLVVPAPDADTGWQRCARPRRPRDVAWLLRWRGAGSCGAGAVRSRQRRAGAAGSLAATLAVRRRAAASRQLRRAEESAALQGALDVLVGELRIGAHPVAAFGVAAAEVDGTVAASLRAVAARARLGADVAAGLRSVAAHSPLPAHWERLAVCWQLAQTHGLADRHADAHRAARHR